MTIAQSSDNCSVTTQSTAGSRSSKGSKGSKAKAQDYQLLLSELQKHQAQFQQARSQLASSLLRMGEGEMGREVGCKHVIHDDICRYLQSILFHEM